MSPAEEALPAAHVPATLPQLLFRFASPADKAAFAVGALCSAARGASLVVFYEFYRRLFEELSVVDDQLEARMNRVCLAMFIFACATGLSAALEWLLFARWTNAVTDRMKLKLLEALLRRPPRSALADPTAATRQLTATIGDVQRYFSPTTGCLIAHVFRCAAGIAWASVVCWPLVVLWLGFVPFTSAVYAASTRCVARFAAPSNDEPESAGERFSKELRCPSAAGEVVMSRVVEALCNVRTVAFFNRIDAEVCRFTRLLHHRAAAFITHDLSRSCARGAMLFLIFFFYPLGLWVGMELRRTGRNGGAAIMSVLPCLFNLIASISTLITCAESLARARAAAGQLFAVIDAAPPPLVVQAGRRRAVQRNRQARAPHEPFSHDMTSDSDAGVPHSPLVSPLVSLIVRDVSFGTTAENDTLQSAGSSSTFGGLRGVSFELRGGDCLCIVGPSGTGKSTIANLLLGHLAPDSGSITISGRDVCEIGVEERFGLVGHCAQLPVIFSGSVMDNLLLGVRGAAQNGTDEGDASSVAPRAARLCEALDLNGAIAALPDGYNTELNEQCELSGGQRQRLQLVRLLLRDPPILILDEATSAQDHLTEELVYELLKTERIGRPDRITIIITHRSAALKLATQTLANEPLERNEHRRVVYTLRPGPQAPLQEHEPHFLRTNGLGQGRTNRTPQHAATCSPALTPSAAEKVNGDDAVSGGKAKSWRTPIACVADPVAQEASEEEGEEVTMGSLAVLRALLPLMLKSRRNLAAVIVGCCGSALNGAANPLYGYTLALATSLLVRPPAGDFDQRGNYFAAMLVLCCVGCGAGWAAGGLLVVAGQRTTDALRVMAFRRALGAAASIPRAVALQRLTTDTDGLRLLWRPLLGGPPMGMVVLLVATAISFAYQWKLSLLGVALLPFAAAHGAVDDSLKQGVPQRTDEHTATVVFEAMTHLRAVTELGLQRHLVEELRASTRAHATGQRRRELIADVAFHGLGAFTWSGYYAALFWLGTRLVVAGEAAFVDVLVVATCMFRAGMALGEQYVIRDGLGDEDVSAAAWLLQLAETSSKNLERHRASVVGGGAHSVHRRASTDSDRDFPPHNGNATPTTAIAAVSPPAEPLLTLRQVGFRYSRRSPLRRRSSAASVTTPQAGACATVHDDPAGGGGGGALQGVTGVIPRGRLTAVCGKSGAGKSTLLSVLALLPLDGTVTGSVEWHIPRSSSAGGSSWRPRIGLAQQQPQLFAGTVAENVAFGLPEFGASAAPDEHRDIGMDWARHPAVIRASRIAGVVAPAKGDGTAAADLDAAALAKLNRSVGFLGGELSGGERARVAIARALAPEPDLLLLDEVAASLDRETAEAFHTELKEALRTAGITAVYVTHDVAFAEAHCDHIIILKDGTST